MTEAGIETVDMATEIAMVTETMETEVVVTEIEVATATEIAMETETGVTIDMATEIAMGRETVVMIAMATEIVMEIETGVVTEIETAMATEEIETAMVIEDMETGIATVIETEVMTGIEEEVTGTEMVCVLCKSSFIHNVFPCNKCRLANLFHFWRSSRIFIGSLEVFLDPDTTEVGLTRRSHLDPHGIKSLHRCWRGGGRGLDAQ